MLRVGRRAASGRRDGRDATRAAQAVVPSSGHGSDIDGPPTSSCAAGASRRWTPAGRCATALAVRGGRIVAVGSDAAIATHGSGRGRGSSSFAAGRSRPGFGDAHVHPVSAGLSRLRCDLDGVHGLDAYLAIIARLCRGASRRAVDPRRRLVDGGLPGRRAAPRRPRPRRPGPAGLPGEPRRPHRLGQRPGARAGRDRPPDTLDPRRADRARPGRPPIGGAPGGRGRPRRTLLLPPTSRSDLVAGCGYAQAELHALGITHWQDAIVDPDEARSPTRRWPNAAS